MSRLLLALAVVAALARPLAAVETTARQAFLVETTTWTVLLEKNPDELMVPSSMSKVMTVYMVFERLAEGSLSLDDTFRVSEKAWKKEGSKMFVEVGTRVSVEDLLRGIIVQSGNDASIVIAEGLAGTEEAFAADMTRRARELGLHYSVFKNSSGWPEDGHLMTARELALLSQRTIEDFPEYYHYYAETTFTYNGIRQANRNPLLFVTHINADGLKTGQTEAAGHGLVVSATEDDRRLILVLNGLESTAVRAQEAEHLIEWGFREFKNYDLFEAGEVVTQAEVWLGAAATVPLVIEDDLVLTLKRRARPEMRVSVVYDGPIPAPITKGTKLAKLVVAAPEAPTVEVPLVAGADVEKLSLFRRIGAALEYLLWGAESQ